MMERILVLMPSDLVDALEDLMELNAKIEGENRNMSALVRKALYFYLRSKNV